MATNMVIPLDQAMAQLYCGVCISNGTPGVMLMREMHLLKCGLGHQFNSVDEAIARGSTMVPLPLNERPPITSVKWEVFIHPKVRDMLTQKYRGRLWATLDSIFGVLADGNVLVIEGKDAAKLKARGAANGTQVIALLASMDSIESENKQLRAKIEQYDAIFRQAGVSS
jgi:hypothetical protein